LPPAILRHYAAIILLALLTPFHCRHGATPLALPLRLMAGCYCSDFSIAAIFLPFRMLALILRFHFHCFHFVSD